MTAHPHHRQVVGTANIVVSTTIALAVLISCFAAGALAHGGNSKDYRSVVTSVMPASLPIDVVVKGGDDRLRIRNQGDKPLVVYGYESDERTRNPFVAFNQYLRISPAGVDVNVNSTAYYLNQDRYGTKVPDQLPKTPSFKRVVRGVPVYTFHDHRIHWMSTTPPPSVDVQDPSPQKVLVWKIPVKYGTTTGFIAGKLTYIGGRKPGLSLSQWLVIAALGGMVLIFIVDYLRRRS